MKKYLGVGASNEIAIGPVHTLSNLDLTVSR